MCVIWATYQFTEFCVPLHITCELADLGDPCCISSNDNIELYVKHLQKKLTLHHPITSPEHPKLAFKVLSYFYHCFSTSSSKLTKKHFS